MLLTSLLLVAIVSSFCLISYLNLLKQFEQQRAAEHLRYSQEVQGLIDQSYQHLQRLGGIIPTLNGMHDALLSGNAQDITLAFDSHWPLLQLHMGLEVVRFYDSADRLIVNWGTTELKSIEADTSLVRQVNLQEYPTNGLDCNLGCTHYVLAPMLLAGKNIGAVLLGTSLADTILGFKQVSGTDIGLLVRGTGPLASAMRDKYIPGWNARVVALTNSERNTAILKKVSQRYPRLEQMARGTEIVMDNHYYEVKLLPLRSLTITNPPELVIISDITPAIKTVHNWIGENLLIGGIGLLFSEIILFAILSAPLSRLNHIARTLPLLAKSAFEDARKAIRAGTRRSRRSRSRTRDEINILDDTAITLSYQLEELEEQVIDRTLVLAKRMDELSKERDFVNSLLNTAQIIILTQNSRGEILTLNNYGASLMHYTAEELQGRPFTDLLSPAGLTPDIVSNLHALCREKTEQLRHEAVTLRKDGSIRHVVWLHSRLSMLSEDDPELLSVGLDITERKEAESRLSWLADHDSLTGLANRRRFLEELENALAAAQRYGRTGALLFFDLDQFKYVNDTSGHEAGDTLLKAIARMLPRVVRATDAVGRLGGDEFGVILPETGAEGAIEVAEKISDYLGKTGLALSGKTHKTSASIGIALFPDHATDVHDLLAFADLAMYQAKESGRGGWHLFSSEDRSRERIQTLVYWKEKIEHALANDSFLLYYQPIMDVRTEAVAHYEVLLRMRDDDGTIITPGAFIPAAERAGLIHAIDHMIIRKATAHIAGLDAQYSHISLSLNLSGYSFEDPQLLHVLQDALQTYAIDPQRLIFEITETAAVADLPSAAQLMASIKALGCSFALDDFGVGFSSFYYIKQLPIDYVKIDGSFIRNLAGNKDDQILVKALSDVAREFGKKIVAECVEDAATLHLLSGYRVDFAQGYFIGRPAPAEEFFSVMTVEQ